MEHRQSTSDRRYLRCVVGAGTYCLPLEAVGAVRRLEDLRPNLEGHRPAGWVQVSGREAPVFRLDSLMGVGRSSSRLETFLVVGPKDDPWALGVDRISKPFASPREHRAAFPLVEGGVISPFFSGAALDGDRLVPILAVDRLRQTADGLAGVEPPARMPRPEARQKSSVAVSRPEQWQLLVFSANGSTTGRTLLGVPLWLVSEVQRRPSILPLPGAISFVLGVSAWSRRTLPVLDLGLRLGIADHVQSDPSRLVVVHAPDGSGSVGLCARSDVHLRRVDAGARGRRGSEGLDPSLTRAVFDLGDEPLVIPDLTLLIQGGDAVESQVREH